MTDAERYSQLIGVTPPINSNGSFAGVTEEERATSRLARYVTKVWLYEHPAADTGDELLKLDPELWHVALQKYEAAGGQAHRGVEGATLFEAWAAHQFFQRKRFSVLLSDSCAAAPIDGVPRVALLSSGELSNVLESLLPVWDKASLVQEDEVPALMALGSFGHIIRLRARSASLEEIYYFDSWPGPSLLCQGNNAAGLRAQLVQPKPLRWSITRAEFEQTAYALIVPTQALSWTRYGEVFSSYAELRKSDIFGRFRLRETDSFRATEVMRVQPCITRVQGFNVEIEFYLDLSDGVRLARVTTEPQLVSYPDAFLAKLIVHLCGALENTKVSGRDTAIVQSALQRTLRTGSPSFYVGRTISANLGLIKTEQGPQVIAELLPA